MPHEQARFRRVDPNPNPNPNPNPTPNPNPNPNPRYDDDRTALARRHALVVRAAALVCRRHGLGVPIEDVSRPRSQ